MVSFRPQQWVVVFSSEANGFFSRFVRKDNKYQHVSLFFKRELGWYMINPHSNYWAFEELEVMADKDFKKYIFLMPSCFKWIHLRVDKPNSGIAIGVIPTCVEVVKRFMGIKLGFCISCLGLYKQIVKRDNKTNYTILETGDR